MALDSRIAAVTDRIIERSKPTRRRYLELMARAEGARDQPPAPQLRQFRARLRCIRRGQGGDQPLERAQHRHRHRLQRHAVGASALWPLPRADEDLRARGRRNCAGRGRSSGDVRRRDPGPAGHGPVAVQPRRDRDGHGDRAQPRHVRRCGPARHLRQDRARASDRRAPLRPSADAAGARRADAVGPAQQGKAADPPALRGGQGRQGRAAQGREPVLSFARHLHLLRHRQFQPDDDGADGAAHPQRGLHQSRNAAAPGADPRRGSPPCRAGEERRAAAGAGRRRESDRQRDDRPRRDRRLDQPFHPFAGDRERRGDRHRLAGFRRPVGGGAADRARLSQRRQGRERLPGRGRHGVRRLHARRAKACCTPTR